MGGDAFIPTLSLFFNRSPEVNVNCPKIRQVLLPAAVGSGHVSVFLFLFLTIGVMCKILGGLIGHLDDGKWPVVLNIQ